MFDGPISKLEPIQTTCRLIIQFGVGMGGGLNLEKNEKLPKKNDFQKISSEN